MSNDDNLIQFDLIEEHKENIQSLPSGRSAKSLARILSPRGYGKEVPPEETKTLNDAIRKEYEKELENVADLDDPLEPFVKYVKWTLEAYPSPTAPQSQLLPLLERATKAFLNSPDYKNDPRYLRLWLQHIQFFADAPREVYAFLCRHGIGEHLALFYEEFAAWLENAGRWNQADEVYRMGIEKEARPTERLMRKYTQFQQRYEARPMADNEPSSPALPKMRAALAAKIDPFATASTEEPTQQSRATSSSTSKTKKPKMAIFSDANAQAPPPGSSSTSGWDSIGSMKERKKENTFEAQPWTGQTLKAGKRVGTASKMEVFKDQNNCKQARNTRQSEPVVNPRTGRAERVFVDMDAVYTETGKEYSFEELRALHRGWAGMNWRKPLPLLKDNANARIASDAPISQGVDEVENLSNTLSQTLDITEPTLSQEITKQSKPAKQKKLKVREVKQETQTVKLRTDSPSKPKPRKKIFAEPTMTLHSKAAHNDIYEMYNSASRPSGKDDTQSGAETDLEDDTFSTAGDSMTLGHISTTNSEFGDETVSSMRSFGADDTNASPWSDFTTGKISKVLKKARSAKHKRNESEDHTENIATPQSQCQDGFDTQAIAELANQDFGDLDTMAIARIAGDSREEPIEILDDEGAQDNLKTPVEAPEPEWEMVEVAEQPRYVPIPPEDYEPTPARPYRDDFVAQNKLSWMTPIAERTESSLAASTIYHNHFSTAKTPSRSHKPAEQKFESPSKLHIVDLLLESPRPGSSKRRNEEDVDEEHSPKKLVAELPAVENGKILFPVSKADQSSTSPAQQHKDDSVFNITAPPVIQPEAGKRPVHKGPIINDLQCNPCDDTVIEQILKTVHPAPSTYPGFNDYSSEPFNHFHQIRSFAKKQNNKSKSSPRKALSESTRSMAPLLKFNGTSRVYAVKRELGEGAFAPVYLVESEEKDKDDEEKASRRGAVEALKAENEPKTLQWEFHILHLLKSRLGRSSRTMQSIILAHECHLYRDECYLVLEYHSQGTLLDLVNACRSESTRAGKTAEGLEEPVVMWLGVELLRTMEDFHKVGILHGDLKADNCLVRLDAETDLVSAYNRHGENGWKGKGLTLIDFGRGIDTRAFKLEARFIADWKAQDTDCPEIREAKPWKWEIDLFGAAGVIHSLLFGKYIETVSVSGGGLGQKKEWKLRDNFKRYWEKDIWTEVFSTLLNAGGKKGDEVKKDLQRLRAMMEDWLETEGERSGRDLRAGIRRCERLVGATKETKARR